MTIKEQIESMAKQHNVGLTDKYEKIARARELTECGLDKCICHPSDKDMFCISKKCMEHIKEKGVCHCNCYKRLDDE